MVLKKLVSVPSGTVYGIEKAFREVVQYCREVDMYPKFNIFLDFRFFQAQNWANPFHLAPDYFWNPIFDQVVAFHEFFKCYLGIWLNF